MITLGIDPGSSMGVALCRDGHIVWCRQVPTAGEGWNVVLLRYRFAFEEARREMTAEELTSLPDRVQILMEAPCYEANRKRKQGTSEVLAERVGMIRALCWQVFGRAPVDVSWRAWRAKVDEGRTGPAEDRALGYALEVLEVPAGMLMGPRGAALKDAASACCIAAYGLAKGER